MQDDQPTIINSPQPTVPAVPVVQVQAPNSSAMHEVIATAVDAKVGKLERNFKTISTIGIGSVIALYAVQYWISESKVANSFMREQVVKDAAATMQAQNTTNLALSDLSNSLKGSTQEQKDTRVEIGSKLDKVADGQKEVTTAITKLVEHLDRNASNVVVPQQPQIQQPEQGQVQRAR